MVSQFHFFTKRLLNRHTSISLKIIHAKFSGEKNLSAFWRHFYDTRNARTSLVQLSEANLSIVCHRDIARRKPDDEILRETQFLRETHHEINTGNQRPISV